MPNPPAPPGAVHLDLGIHLPYHVGPGGADFWFTCLPARTPCQTVLSEVLDLGGTRFREVVDPATGTRLLRLHAAPGPIELRYRGTIAVEPRWCDPALLEQVPVDDLPEEVLPFLLPSRYCPSDRLPSALINEAMAAGPGYARALAIRDGVRRRVQFRMQGSNSTTDALDTLRDGIGVCRDFAHLMIAWCRAATLPARFTTGIDFGADPALGPTDFHAYVEVYLSGRWWIFDPSGTAIPLGFMRLASGRDAADAAFATSFGPVQSFRPTVSIAAVPGRDGRLRVPEHHPWALCTAGPAPRGRTGMTPAPLRSAG